MLWKIVTDRHRQRVVGECTSQREDPGAESGTGRSNNDLICRSIHCLFNDYADRFASHDFTQPTRHRLNMSLVSHPTIPHETSDEVDTGLELRDEVIASPDLIDAVGKIQRALRKDRHVLFRAYSFDLCLKCIFNLKHY